METRERDNGAVYFGVSFKANAGELERSLSPEQMAALMDGIAQCLAADRTPADRPLPGWPCDRCGSWGPLHEKGICEDDSDERNREWMERVANGKDAWKP